MVRHSAGGQYTSAVAPMLFSQKKYKYVKYLMFRRFDKLETEKNRSSP
jgi:hypothetical protein